jgi:hypothetical protein
MLGLGREAVLREHSGRSGADRDFADKPVVGPGVAEDPACSVDVQDHRERPGGSGRTYDPDGHVAVGAARHLDPFVGDGGLDDLSRLCLVDDFASLVGAEVVQKGGFAFASANSWAAGSSGICSVDVGDELVMTLILVLLLALAAPDMIWGWGNAVPPEGCSDGRSELSGLHCGDGDELGAGVRPVTTRSP